jgi:predicted component of type VI protein secretion system
MRREPLAVAATPVQRPALIWEGPGRPVEFDLSVGNRFTIGRDGTNTIVLASPFVSKAHAVLEYRDGRYVIEDLRSANGTKVNGAPVQVYAVTPGDVIEVGDQRLSFVDRAAKARAPAAKPTDPGTERRPAKGAAVPAPAGRGKTFRLAMVAAATLVLTAAVMMLIVRSGQSPAPTPGETTSPPTKAPQAVAPVSIAPNPELTRSIEAYAARAGIRVTDALYDEGLAQVRGGRYRQAAQLFAAVLERDGAHQQARARLEETLVELERAVVDHLARADRAFGELRYDDAIVEWEKVSQLVNDTDPRLATARAGIARATQARQPR